VLFTKFATSLTGAYDTITCPRESQAIDYEGELAVVIGRSTRRVRTENRFAAEAA
jgi:acylpyruvate hydrolase